MKFSLYFSTLFALLFSLGCEFEINPGIPKSDPIPHSKLKAKGLETDPVIMTVDGEKSMNNVFTFGRTVEFTFNNVTGMKEINGFTYPKMSMRITNIETDSVLYFERDILGESKVETKQEPLVLSAHFKTSVPNLNDAKYLVEVKIWDQKGPGSIDFSLPFQVKPSDLLSVQREGLSYSNIYLWDQTNKKVVFDHSVSPNSQFILINEGLSGFDIVDDKAFPEMSILLTDKDGNAVLSNENLLAPDSETGIAPLELKDNQAPVTFNVTPGFTSNPYLLTVKIFDLKNPEKHITVKTELNFR